MHWLWWSTSVINELLVNPAAHHCIADQHGKEARPISTLPFLPILAHSFLQSPAALLHCFWPRPPSTPQAAGGPFAVTTTTAHRCVPSGAETQVIPRAPIHPRRPRLLATQCIHLHGILHDGCRLHFSFIPPLLVCPSAPWRNCHHPQLVSFPYVELDN